MAKYKIIIQYDGTDYSGWQVQPDSKSIQATIQQVLQQFLQEKISIIAAGRTDSGVHALGQVAHFSFPKEIDMRRFLVASNGLLPPAIRILEIEKVDDSFHAQYDAKGKIYHYHLWTEKIMSPFHQRIAMHIRDPFNCALLKEGAKFFIGTHDFTSFANRAKEGAAAKCAIRTIHRLDLVPETGGYRLEFEGNGFLYKMVRNITGTLLDVAKEKIALEEIPRILKAKDRCQASKAAAPHGLFLVKVFY